MISRRETQKQLDFYIKTRNYLIMVFRVLCVVKTNDTIHVSIDL